MMDMVVAVTLIICLLTDLRKHKIYNIVLLPALLFGLFYNLGIGGWPGLVHSLLGFLVGVGILIIPFALGGMGGGDVKLLAIIGALKGPTFVLYTAIGMALAGGVLALTILLYRGWINHTLGDFFRSIWLMLSSGFKVIEFNSSQKKILLPYGLAIVVGAVGAYWWMR